MSREQTPCWLYVPEWLEGDIWHFPYAYRGFKKYIPPRSRVLEVGFGSGRILTRICGELDCSGVGVDVNDGAFASIPHYSRLNGAEVEAVRGTGFALPFRDESFDVVYSEGVIEHFPIERSQEMVREHARVCRRGGIVLISTPNKFAVVHSLTKLLLGKRFLFYPEASLSTFELSRLMARAGLRPVASDGFAFGCQFYMLKAFFLDQAAPPPLQKWAQRLLTLFCRTGLYHVESPALNSLIGFQALVVGRK
ncbi:MAG: methyltransferase domain-containing protein [Chloroflexota bacterium]|nr:methyltransferase domain-containing protein [Chloroflexota bacterium]